MYRMGVDIGGTFTDVVVAAQGGEIVRAKALTTPEDYTDGVFAAVGNAADALGATLEELMAGCVGFVNGTTVVTNAIAQHSGRRVGLLTTRGFKQQIYIHRGIREIQLDLQKETRPPDIVRQRHVAEIDERVTRHGDVLVDLDEDGVRSEVKRLVDDEGIEALAICFLWAFRHPEHERRAAEIVRELYPDLFLTLSCDIYPRIREYERMNTAVLNSFVSEGVETYIGKLMSRAQESGLAEGRLAFVQSLGGHMTASQALSEPIRLSHSGPVGGVVAALPLDVALVYAETADEYGNAQVVGTGYMDALLGAAARQVIVQVDRVVPTETIRANPERTWYWKDARVVRAPFGTHPYSNGWMAADAEHLKEFVAAGRAGGEELERYMARHVHDAPDHEAYLEQVGIRRLSSLLV